MYYDKKLKCFSRLKMRILLFLFLISSFLFSNDLKPISIQLKWKHQFQFAGFYMAKELGFYKDLGLDVELKEFDKKIIVTMNIPHISTSI